MRNLTKRGLGFYSPSGNHSISSAFRPLIDREEVTYGWRRLRASDVRPGIAMGFMAVGRGLRDPRTLAAISVLVVALTLSTMLFGGSERGSAYTWPVNVRGFVTDSVGNPVQGANVTVDMMSGATVRATKYYDATLSSGLYSVTFQSSEWDPGNTIVAIATYGIYTNQNSTVAAADPIQYVNVTLAMTIPEFGSVMGLSTSFVTMGMVAIVILASRRRKDRLAP